jgi:hypothetical protein
MSSPNETEPKNDVWTTKSKKEMVLGIAIMGAGVGSEPILALEGGSFLWLSLLVMLGGLYLVILGFLQQE